MSASLSRIEFRQLRYFIAAADHGSFRKAGMALAVSESSISRRVRDLEHHLGASLFRRYNGGVSLTEAGRRFLVQARNAMRHLGNGARDVGAIGRSESGHIRVGVFLSLASGFLHELFQAYRAGGSGVQIDFCDGHPAEHIAAVRLHQLDVAFLTGTSEHAGCRSEQLWLEQVFAVLPAGHPLATRRSLDWQDLAMETFIVSEQAPGLEIHDFLIKRLSSLGRRPEISRQDVGRDNLLSLVAIGRGITLTSEATTFTRSPGIVYRRIGGEALPFSAVWSPMNDNPALKELLGLARYRREANNSLTLNGNGLTPPPSDALCETPDPSP